MPAYRYVEENGSAAMLANKRAAGVTPEVNLKEHVTHISLCQVQIRLPTLALKPRGDVIRSTSQSPHKGTYVFQFKKTIPQLTLSKFVRLEKT